MIIYNLIDKFLMNDFNTDFKNLINKIRKIDLLKIDVEGSEFDVLKGRKNILKNEKKITCFNSSL
tara:strand:- start:2288 stop:2482 length:195 start_codon:yes stop_codon:yes gene_type:complete